MIIIFSSLLCLSTTTPLGQSECASGCPARVIYSDQGQLSVGGALRPSCQTLRSSLKNALWMITVTDGYPFGTCSFFFVAIDGRNSPPPRVALHCQSIGPFFMFIIYTPPLTVGRCRCVCYAVRYWPPNQALSACYRFCCSPSSLLGWLVSCVLRTKYFHRGKPRKSNGIDDTPTPANNNISLAPFWLLLVVGHFFFFVYFSIDSPHCFGSFTEYTLLDPGSFLFETGVHLGTDERGKKANRNG